MRDIHPHPYTITDLQRLIDFRRAYTKSEYSNDYPTAIDLQELLLSPSSTNVLSSLWEDVHGNIIAYGIVALSYCNLYLLIQPQAQGEELAVVVYQKSVETRTSPTIAQAVATQSYREQ